MDTWIGRAIAGYRIEAVLGHGGMSCVYLAEQLRLGRKVALKVLASGLATDEGFRERFAREARQAAEIDHPNIVPVYDAGDAEGHLYIAMRFVEGRDLGTVLAAERPLGVGRTLFLLEQAAAALDAAHARGLVHRDVKPANILIEDGSERVFVTDFGIAKRAASPGLTRTGFFLGTVDYAAPEQIEGKEVDARADVYALGCVFYECLAGRAPFERDNEVAVMHAHLTEPPPPLTGVRSELPAALDAVVATALAKSRDERYRACGELIAAARSAALAEAPTPRGAAVERRARRSQRRSSWPRWAALAAVAALAGALALAAIVVLTSDDEPNPSTTVGTGAGDSGVPLAVYIPDGLLTACKNAPIYDGATATAQCAPPNGTKEFFPERVTVSLFSGSDVYDAYTVEARAHGFEAPSQTGACDARRWDGAGAWVHGPSSPGGSRFCYRDGSDAVLAWTHEDTGEPDHRNVFAVARAPAAAQDELLAWWRFWRHRIGRVSF